MAMEEAELIIDYERGGFKSAAAADTDGDGCAELGLAVVEEPTYEDAAGDYHSKYGIGIMSGNTSGQVVFEEEARAFVHGEWDHDTFVVASGDLDGDGAATDWLIGARDAAYGNSTPGAVYWFPDLSRGEFEESDAAAAIWGEEERGALFAYDIAVGDTNGDGPDDVAISYSVTAGKGYEFGVVLVQGPLVGDMIASEADASIEADELASAIGCQEMSAEADLGGDGINDLAVPDYGWAGRGRVSIFTGPVEGLYSTDGADASLVEPACNNASAGRALSCGGDVDGDGYSDVLVGAPNSETNGRTYLVLGPVEGTQSLWDAAGIFDNGETYACLGMAVSITQDLDGDGHADPAMGAINYSAPGGLENEGAVFVFYGPVTGCLDADEADAIISPSYDKDNYNSVGGMLSGVGDTDGDGYDDLLIGSNATCWGTLIRGGLR